MKTSTHRLPPPTPYLRTHARHDRAHCLAPGLFRSLQRGERRRNKLDVVYEHGDLRIEFKGPEPLGADDLRVLQGLVALAGPQGLLITPETKSSPYTQLRLRLEPKWDAVEENSLVVKGSYGALAREIGYADADNARIIRRCIERLWSVSVIVQRGSRRLGFRLLSEYASDEADGRLFVALNPLITLAILGERPHARIEMQEVRALRSDAARLIHQRLCGWIDPGESGRVTIDTLCSYAWPAPAASPETAKKRRQTVRSAMAELAALGWGVTEYAKGLWEVRRPRRRQQPRDLDLAPPLNVPEPPA